MNDHSADVTALSATIPEIPFQRFRLENGLTLLVHEDTRTPTVAVHVAYGIGAKDEPAGMFGFAHLLEHLMFSGSAALPGSYISHLERAGAQGLNGVTSADMTQYFQSVPVGSLDFTLFAESDRMGHLLAGLQPTALEVQRQVVTREMEENELQPYGAVQGLLLRHLFPVEHPYAHKVAGEQRDLCEVNYDQVQEWVSRFYRPNNAVITLVGDISAQQALEKVERWFGDIAPGEPLERCERWVPSLPQERRVTFQDRVEATLLRICWVIPPSGEPCTNALTLFATQLNDNAQSILAQRLMVENPLVSDLSAFVEPGMLASYFNLRLVLAPGVVAVDAERVALAALDAMLAEEMDPDLLQYSQQVFLHTALQSWSDNLSLAAELGKHEIAPAGAEGCRQQVVDALEMTTTAVMAAARRWLGDGRLVVTVEPYHATQASRAVARTRTVPPVEVAPMPALPLSQSLRLTNGLQVTVTPASQVALLSASLIINAGSRYDPPGLAGLAHLVAGLVMGAGDENDRLQPVLQQRHVGVAVDVSAENVALRMQMPEQHAEEIFTLLAGGMETGEFRDETVIAHRDSYLHMLANRSTVEWALPVMTFPVGHPLARPAFTEGDARSLGQIDAASVRQFFAGHYRASEATLLLRSALPLPQLAALLERAFSRWATTATALPETLPLPEAVPEGALMLADRPGAPVTTLSGFFVLNGHGIADDAAIQLIHHLLADSFGSRINYAMREVWHLTYNVTASQQAIPGGQLLGFQMTVAADSTLAAMRALCHEIAELSAGRPPSRSEIASLIQIAQLRLSQPEGDDYETLCQQESLVRQQHPLDHRHQLMAGLDALSVTQVEQMIRRFLRPVCGKWILEGDVARYAGALEQMLDLPATPFPTPPDALYQ